MSTQETIRLYDNDAYATEFEAAVLSCEPRQTLIICMRWC